MSPRAMVNRFAEDKRGAIAITFALALLPLVGAVGAAVDYSRLSLAHTTKQSVADAAALAGAQAMLAKNGQIASVVEAAGLAAATAVVNGSAPGAQKTITPVLSTKSINVKISQAKNVMFGSFIGGQRERSGPRARPCSTPPAIASRCWRRAALPCS
jgi:uncharacterized membrane protein